MDIFSSLILGFIQGITEFLPVSSSAHLVFAQALIPGFYQPGILFDVFLHGGTLLAVLIYFRKTILEILTFKNPNLIRVLFIGTLPAGVLGFVFNDFFESTFSSVWFAAATLLISGVMNWLVDAKRIANSSQRIGLLTALVIGVFQAIAIIPGISRSSATIFSGVFLGLDRKKAAEFSFLLSVPAIVGAIVLQITKHGFQFETSYLGGFIVAFIVGYWSIGFLLKLLQQRKYKIFAIYCWILGSIVLATQIL